MNKPESYSKNLDTVIKLLKKYYNTYGKLIKWKSEPESILDFGIGDGRVSKEVLLPKIPKNIKEYIGVDISEAMLKTAKETISDAKFSTFQLDAATKNLPDELKNRFDHIFASGLFHHVQDTRQVLTNIYEMLKPGGQVFFTAFDQLFADEAYDRLDKGKWKIYNNREAISPFYKSEDPVKEYENLINSIGFVDINIFVEPFEDTLPEKAFEEMFAAVNTRIRFVNEEDKVEYLKDFVEESKNTSLVILVVDDKTKQKFYKLSNNMIVGIISKPQ